MAWAAISAIIDWRNRAKSSAFMMAFLLGVALHAGSPPSRNTLPRFWLAFYGAFRRSLDTIAKCAGHASQRCNRPYLAPAQLPTKHHTRTLPMANPDYTGLVA